MLYIVEMAFSDPSKEDEWNDWYNVQKSLELLSVPGFNATQRFKTDADVSAPYMAIHSITSTDLYNREDYRKGGGGSAAHWNDLQPNWTRRIFSGIDEMPGVDMSQVLVMVDIAPDDAPDLGLDILWTDGLDWETAASYRDAIMLDSSVPHRGFAIVDPATADALPKTPGVNVYRPIYRKQKSS
jgi:hypothetical protein